MHNSKILSKNSSYDMGSLAQDFEELKFFLKRLKNSII